MTRDTSIGSVLVYVSSGVDDALGENILKLPMLLALADQFPGARISWVPGTSGFMFLERHLAPLVGGRIHEFITDLEVPIEPWNWPRVHHAIRAHRFDLVIDTQRNLERLGLILVQRAERIGRCLFLHGLVDHSTPPRCSRRRSMPRRMRALMVPSGCCSRVAMSLWLSPVKKASSIAMR